MFLLGASFLLLALVNFMEITSPPIDVMSGDENITPSSVPMVLDLLAGLVITGGSVAGVLHTRNKSRKAILVVTGAVLLLCGVVILGSGASVFLDALDYHHIREGVPKPWLPALTAVAGLALAVGGAVVMLNARKYSKPLSILKNGG
jgi:uncharacterized membrane protein YidH (DUF202 family)